mmetsp:Transcript_16940/g.25752  ORF Transcript_16940/g.25752 Transcript_16940/m.25752 type:complete len:317 (+) Transcript_16940:18-968(+)
MYEWTVPIISGTTLIVGSGLTIYIDRLERLRDTSSPRPVMYRFFSQAILAIHQWPHWIFVITCNIFGPCFFLTAIRQASLLENQCTGQDCSSLARALRMDGWVTSCCLYLDAWIPLGRPVITHISHTIVAIGFFVFGTHYVYNTILVAKILAAKDDDYGILLEQQMLVNLRTTFLAIMVISGLVIAVTTSPAVQAHGRLLDHQFRGTKESQMKQLDIIKCRRLEACMSTAQMALGIGLGLTQFTAALDVFKLMENNSAGDKRHIIAEEFWAIPMFVIMLSLTIMEYLYRHKIYNWCQAMLLRFRMTPHNSNKTKAD